jgi:cytochrome c5
MKPRYLSSFFALCVLAVPCVAQETHEVDHPAFIESLETGNRETFDRGKALYQLVCINCHGTQKKAGTLPTALRFWEAPMKNGSDPRAMYRTLTKGFNQMVPQNWMTPEQKYQVIHYIREEFLKEANPSQYKEVDNAYLAGIQKEVLPGPAPQTRALNKPYLKMDFGPNMNYTFEVGPDNIAYKAIAVRLDQGGDGITKGKAWLAYDHDLMRVAAIWNGNRFCDWRSIGMDGSHGTHPKIVGDKFLVNAKAPGWAKPGTDDFTDPRFLGRDKKPYGPLPRDWVHYKGLYHHGQKVLLKYTVGAREVLEMANLANEAPLVVARNFRIGPGRQSMLLHLGSGGEASVIEGKAKESIAVAHFDKLALAAPPPDPSGQMTFGGTNFSISAWIKTKKGGAIFCKSAPTGQWSKDGKVLFVRGGRLTYDVGWVGDASSRTKVADGKWRHVAMTHQANGSVKLFVDGRKSGDENLPSRDASGHVARLGYCATDFCPPFEGDMDEVRIYHRLLTSKELSSLAKGEDVNGTTARWTLDEAKGKEIANETGPNYAGALAGNPKLIEGKFGKALRFDGKSRIEIGGKAKASQPEPETAKPVAKDLSGPVLAVSATGEVEGISWVTEDGHLRLRIPASNKERQLKVLHWRGDASQLANFGKIIDSAKIVDLTAFTKDAPARWAHDVEVTAKVASNDKAYVVDEIVTPPVTSWNSWMRLSGFDFFKDGKRAAVSTWNGDVWLVAGLGPDLGKGTLKWRRIGSGLFQPLGVRVIDETIYLACRDQLVALRDFNGDGETDYYESINNDHQVTEHFHEFAMGLQTDDEGNFYYAKSARHAKTALVPHHGTLIKVSKDGQKTEIIANGFRAANGVCLNPDGSFFVTDQEGHWTPKNRVNWVTKGGFYGNMMGYTEIKDTSDSAMSQPLAWLTNSFNRSPGELVWVKSKKWGPLAGALLDVSYGMGRVFVVLNEKVNGQLQGGEYQLPIPDFPTGVMRGRFHKDDGQLYVCGMFAWAGNKRGDGGFYRIRYTGKPVCLPTTLEASTGMLRMKFSEKLDPQEASSPSSYNLKAWSIKRTGGYGSRHYDEKIWKVEKAKLLSDGLTVELTVPDIQPTWCMEVRYELKTARGTDASARINNTIHNLSTK